MNTRTMLLGGWLVLALAGCGVPEPLDPGVATEEVAMGPNGGRLLVEGDFSLELAIFEAGAPPEFRAWAWWDSRPVAPEALDLTVELVRLGGVREVFAFGSAGTYLRGEGLVAEPHSFEVTVAATHQDRRYRWHYQSFEGRTRIDPEMAERLEIETESATGGEIVETAMVYGTVRENAETARQIHARFEGMIRRVEVSVGERVAAGDLLAEVESDQSLERYPIRAPVAGVIGSRSANPGEHTAGRTLFTITDPGTLWAEFAVFPGQVSRIREGMAMVVSSAAGNPLGEALIDWISPTAEADQSVRVRVVLDNEERSLRPGTHLTGRIVLARHQVPLAVRRAGLQTFRDWTVVFVRVGDVYEVRMLELGRSDAERVEVLGGLQPGERYVTRGSYLVKADIEKAGAAHEH